jgi:hypothetical protein
MRSYSDTIAKLNAIDVSPAIAARQALRDSIADKRAVIKESEFRVQKLSAEIDRFETYGPDPLAAARALMEGRDLAKGIGDLNKERIAVIVGLEQLRREIADVERQIVMLTHSFDQEIIAASRDLLSTVEERVNDAMTEMISAYGVVTALWQVTRSNEISRIQRNLGSVVSKAGDQGLITTRKIPVDGSVLELNELEVVKFAGRTIPIEVSRPVEADTISPEAIIEIAKNRRYREAVQNACNDCREMIDATISGGLSSNAKERNGPLRR